MIIWRGQVHIAATVLSAAACCTARRRCVRPDSVALEFIGP